MILNSTKGLHESAFIHRWWNSKVQTSQFWLRRLLWVRYFYTRWRSSKCAYVSIRLFKHSRGCHLVTGLCYGPWIDLSLVVHPLSSVLCSKCIHTDPHLSASVFIYFGTLSHRSEPLKNISNSTHQTCCSSKVIERKYPGLCKCVIRKGRRITSTVFLALYSLNEWNFIV